MAATTIKLQKFTLFPYSSKPHNDIEQPLKQISLDTHEFYQGCTRVRASFVLVAPAGAKITGMELLLFKGAIPMGCVLRRGYPLDSAGVGAVVPKKGSLDFSRSNAITFRIPMAGIDPDIFEDNTKITATLIVTTSHGAAETVLPKTLKPLVRIGGSAKRYSGRDAEEGGDDWVIPSLRPVLEYFSENHGIYINDISKMNGGKFPPHKTHKFGAEVDVRTTFNRNDFKIDQSLADKIVEMLGDPIHGPKIKEVLVTFDSTSTPDFHKRMNLSTVRGTKALLYLRNVKGHSDHIHLIFNS